MNFELADTSFTAALWGTSPQTPAQGRGVWATPMWGVICQVARDFLRQAMRPGGALETRTE